MMMVVVVVFGIVADVNFNVGTTPQYNSANKMEKIAILVDGNDNNTFVIFCQYFNRCNSTSQQPRRHLFLNDRDKKYLFVTHVADEEGLDMIRVDPTLTTVEAYLQQIVF